MARRSDHSRDELHRMTIEAARTIITQDGIENVSARKIAQRIGYTAGTLYQAFNNIHEIILHANALSLSDLLESLNQAYNKHRSPQLRLIAIAEAYLTFAQTRHHQWSAIFRHSLPEHLTVPDWYLDKIDALFLITENTLRTLSPQQDRHAIQMASRVLWSGVHGICILHVGNKLHMGGLAKPKELVHSLINHYIQSWTTENNSQ